MEFTKADLNKTIWAKPEWLAKNRKWYIVDAQWKTLWRLAVEIAKKLTGKWKPHYSDFWDAWDFVVVINASKIKVTWNKMQQKMYYRYSWYKWNLKQLNLASMLVKNPERVMMLAVRWMLPKNKLRDPRIKRLKVFADAQHKYENLPLETLKIND